MKIYSIFSAYKKKRIFYFQLTDTKKMMNFTKIWDPVFDPHGTLSLSKFQSIRSFHINFCSHNDGFMIGVFFLPSQIIPHPQPSSSNVDPHWLSQPDVKITN